MLRSSATSTLLGFGWLALCLGLSVPASASTEEERTTDEILQEILARRDFVDHELFELLGRRRTAESLAALQQASLAMGAPVNIEIAFDALRHFRNAGELEQRTLSFLERESVSGYVPKQRAAVRVLVKFEEPAYGALREVLDQDRDPVCAALAIGGLLPVFVAEGTPAALEALIADFRPPHSGPARLAVETFESFGGPANLSVFERALSSKRTPAQIKALILEALTESPQPGVDELYAKSLRSKDTGILLAAVRAVQRRDVGLHLDALERLERSREPAVRRAAICARADFSARDAEWIEKMLGAARVGDDVMRLAAALALSKIEDPRAVEALYGLLADSNPSVRAESLRQIVELRRKDSIPILIERLAVETLRLKTAVRRALVLLTGRDLGTNVERWRSFWAGEQESFVLPEALSSEALEARRVEERESNPTRASFYGVRFESDRVCFVIDISGSMNRRNPQGDSRLDVVKRELVATLSAYPDDAYFNLVFFADHPSPWKKGLVRMREKMRKKSIQYVQRQFSNGGTALYDALMRAWNYPEVDTIFLLSDGEPTAGRITAPDRILAEVRRRAEVRDVSIHCISVAMRNRLLQGLAEMTGGEYREVR